MSIDIVRFEEECVELLNRCSILPYTNWKNFEINHGNENNKKFVFNKIKVQVGRKKSGVYIYEKNKKILYVGRGKDLRQRFKIHFLESFSKKSWLGKRHRKFFSKYPGKLKIYYKESKGEKNKILECVLTIKLQPDFGSKQT